MKRGSCILVAMLFLASGWSFLPAQRKSKKKDVEHRLVLLPTDGTTLCFQTKFRARWEEARRKSAIHLSYLLCFSLPAVPDEGPMEIECRFYRVKGSITQNREIRDFGVGLPDLSEEEVRLIERRAARVLFILEQGSSPLKARVARTGLVQEVSGVVSKRGTTKESASSIMRYLIQQALPRHPDRMVKKGASWSFDQRAELAGIPSRLRSLEKLDQISSADARVSRSGEILLDRERIASIGDPYRKAFFERARITRSSVKARVAVSRKDGFLLRGNGESRVTIQTPDEKGAPQMCKLVLTWSLSRKKGPPKR